jgi:hypothetical protein
MRAMRAPSVAVVLAALAPCAAVHAQRVSLKPEPGRGGEVERLVAALAQPESRGAAADKLWRMGAPVVPVLAAAVARGDARSLPALNVLALLGGEARAAVPQLQRLLAAEPPPDPPPVAPPRIALELALAMIGERDTLLVAEFSGRVIELDTAGNVLRSVDHNSVWGVHPLANDRLLVASDGDFVEEIDWHGKVRWKAPVPSGALDARRLLDGTTVVACWTGACVLALGPDGKEKWRIPNVRAVDVEPLPNGGFLVAGHEDKVLLEADAAGKVVLRLPLPEEPMDVDLLPDGNFLVAFDKCKRVVELDRAGNEVRRLDLPFGPEDCHRLRDGRTAVAGDVGSALFDAEGKELWRHAGGHSGHVDARIATGPDAK